MTLGTLLSCRKRQSSSVWFPSIYVVAPTVSILLVRSDSGTPVLLCLTISKDLFHCPLDLERLGYLYKIHVYHRSYSFPCRPSLLHLPVLMVDESTKRIGSTTRPVRLCPSHPLIRPSMETSSPVPRRDHGTIPQVYPSRVL